MKKTKLNYRFHNPNSAEDTADFLCKLLIEANRGKVERAMERARVLSEYISDVNENEMEQNVVLRRRRAR